MLQAGVRKLQHSQIKDRKKSKKIPDREKRKVISTGRVPLNKGHKKRCPEAGLGWGLDLRWAEAPLVPDPNQPLGV